MGGMDSTGITAKAYQRLKDYLGITAGIPQVYDPTNRSSASKSPCSNTSERMSCGTAGASGMAHGHATRLGIGRRISGEMAYRAPARRQ